MEPNYNDDRRLDVLVLGPMGDDEHSPTSTLPVKRALDTLLGEDRCQQLLSEHQIEHTEVHVPEGQDQSEIVENVFHLLDSADLVIFNLNQKEDRPDRANTFYELALVHALGIPSLLVVKQGTTVPFYARTSTQYRVDEFTPEALADALRKPLTEFLDLGNRRIDFTNDRVTQFYGMPLIDISAAVGLATGYYYNFISRLLDERGFLAEYPGKIKEVVYVRPSSIRSTYPADKENLKAQLQQAGLVLEEEEIKPPKGNRLGPIWFDHVQGVVIDIPRTIYPLQRSPRLLSYESRFRRNQAPSAAAEHQFQQRSHQIEESLLDRVESALRFQIRHDGSTVRSNIFHLTTIAEAPALVNELLKGNQGD